MVDHVAGHAAVDADVLARDESRLVGGEAEALLCPAGDDD
jgi:hypothetical protein